MIHFSLFFFFLGGLRPELTKSQERRTGCLREITGKKTGQSAQIFFEDNLSVSEL